LFLSTPNGIAFKEHGDAPCNPYHLDEYTRQELQEMFFEAGWEIAEYRGQYLMQSESEALGSYRKFIKRFWRRQDLIRRFGMLYKLASFLMGKIHPIIELAYSSDCSPIRVEEGFQPAYHYFILKAN